MAPIKIALIGAPGSGKSMIARRVSRRLNTEGKEWVVVDGYVEKLAERTGRTFGDVYNRYGYPLNIMVTAERWRLEDEATRHSMNTITCGSIFETIIYSAAQSVPIANMANEQMMMEETYIADVMMAGFTALAHIRDDYDLLLYLPLTEQPHSWNGVIDAKLDEVLTACDYEAIVLEGTDRKKVNDAEKFIREIHIKATTNYGERGLRAGGETGEGTEHRSDEVPDVSAPEEASASGGAEPDDLAQ